MFTFQGRITVRTRTKSGKNLLILSAAAFALLFLLATVHPVYAAGRNLVGKAMTTTVTAAAPSGSSAQSGAGSAGSSGSAGQAALQATPGATNAATVTSVNTGDEDKYIPYIMTMTLSAVAALTMGDFKIRLARRRSSAAAREEMEAFRRSCGM